jgi:hypothetical protein
MKESMLRCSWNRQSDGTLQRAPWNKQPATTTARARPTKLDRDDADLNQEMVRRTRGRDWNLQRDADGIPTIHAGHARPVRAMKRML